MAVQLSRVERQVLAGFAILAVAVALLNEVIQLKELGESIQQQLLEDHYSALAITETASQAEIETAYQRAMKQFNAKTKELQERARVVAAHHMLANVELRRAYDEHRRMVTIASVVFLSAFVGIPVLVIIYLCVKATVALSGSNDKSDADAFARKVTSLLERLECLITLEVTKVADERLGVQLAPVQGRLQVLSVADGSLVERHNCKTIKNADSVSAGGLPWWDLPVLKEGDFVESVNGETQKKQMLELFGTSDLLNFQIKRQLNTTGSVLPWLCEVELKRNTDAGEKWGCKLSPAKDGSDCLEVTCIDETGAVNAWNKANPNIAVRAGDRLLAVARKLGCEGMLTILRDPSANTSCWLVARGVVLSQATKVNANAEVVCGPFQKQAGDKLGIRIGPTLEPPLRGLILEPSFARGMLVKEVVPGFLVDNWNHRPGVPRVLEGSLVVSVNGCKDPSQFAAELSKSSVQIRLRPPTVAASSEQDSMGVLELNTADFLQAEEPQGLASQMLGAFVPQFLRPRSFEAQLREVLSDLRCEFEVQVQQSPHKKLGLRLSKAELKGHQHLSVGEVTAGGLIADYNTGLSSSSRQPRVRAGDHIVAVNGVSLPSLLVETLSSNHSACSEMAIRFSRTAAHAAPGVWEINITRRPNESWGLQLSEQQRTTLTGLKKAGVLRIDGLVKGSALDRWNKQQLPGQWRIQTGDLLVACEPEVFPSRLRNRLESLQSTRLTLLRWHHGPAPETEEKFSEDTVGTKTTFEVTLMRRNLDERLGLRLCPSSRDPTRTAIEEVVPEGLAALYNKATLAAHSHDSFLAIIAPGDEVESINGVGDPNHFPECCREPQITLCLTRLSPLSTSSMHNATAQIVGNCKLAPLLQPNSTCNSSPLQHQQDHPPADATHNGHICTVTHSINQHQPEMPTESPTCSHLQQQQLLNSAKESTQQLQPSQHLPPTAQHKQQSPESSIEIDCHPQAHKSYGVPLTSDIAKLQDELSCLRDERNSLAAENVRLERAERASTAARLSAEKEVAAVRAELSTAKAELEEKLRSSQEQAQQVEQRLIDEVADLRKRLHEVASSSHHPPTGVLLQPMDTALLELQDLAASLEHLLADDAEPTS